MRRLDHALLLTARVLIGLLFVGGAIQKAFSPGDAQALLTGRGLPDLLVWPALAYNAAAGAALIAGLAVRPVALSLGAYCAATSVFHLIPGDPWQMSIFVKNWAIAGGCLALAVAGAGRFSLPTGRGPSRRRPRL
ncbi:MAG: DoxX family protein [Paracoccaceae bacterium]